MSEILGRGTPAGVSIEPAWEPAVEGLEARLDPSRPATVRAYLPASDPGARARAHEAAAAAAEALGHLQAFGLRPIGELTTREVREADWATTWKRHVPTLRVGRRIVIRPSWRRYRGVGDEVVVTLDPGVAFGTGMHPTTRLCLLGLEGWAQEGRLAGRGVLDVGCGSGILGLAALGLGASRVLGLDTDPLAVAATLANARRNHMEARVRAMEGSLPSPDGPAELIVANLVAGLLVALAGELAIGLRPGGRLLAGGIFADRAPEVRAAFAAAGLRVVGERGEGDWLTFEAERAPAPA